MFLAINDKKRLNINIVINSTASYIFAFLFVYFIYQFTTAIMAAQYNVRTVFFLDRLSYITQDNSPFWYSDSVLTVFTASPIVSIFFALTFIWLYHKLIDDESVLKQFFLWGALHFINRLFGSFIIGSIFYLYGSNLIADWLYLGPEMKILVVSFALIIMIVIGSFSVFPILASANSPELLKEKNRKSFIINQVYIPWLLGSIFLMLFQLPYFPLHESLMHITMLILIAPVYFRYNRFLLPTFDGPEAIYKIPWRFLIILIIFILALKIFLTHGMQFGSETENSSGLSEIIILIAIIILFLIWQMIIKYKKKRNSTRKLLDGF